MRFAVGIDVMPKAEVADPQGQTVARALPALGFEGVEDVRVGKHIELTLEAGDAPEARRCAEALCTRLLANTVIESYAIDIHDQGGARRA